MAASTSRQSARDRICRAFQAQLDREIPLDESVPLAGEKFIDFENSAERLSNTVHAVMVEERAALSPSAVAGEAGRCAYCNSSRVYLTGERRQEERLSPRGEVVIAVQRCRCRSCGRSFSPSGEGLGTSTRPGGEHQGR